MLIYVIVGNAAILCGAACVLYWHLAKACK